MVAAVRDVVSALRGDLDTAVTALRGDLDKEVTALRGEMGAMEARLVRKFEASTSQIVNQAAEEVGKKVANVMLEQLRSQVAAVDEKYKDLPRRHSELRDAFDGHATDVQLHRRRVAVPAKRARRS